MTQRLVASFAWLMVAALVSTGAATFIWGDREGAYAADGSTPDERGPMFGDPAKDAPFVPTPPAVVERMLEMARIKAGESLIDLGSGDGRIVIAAAKRHGARGLGIEHNADLVAYATRIAEQEGVAHLARFARADLFETDLAGAQVIALYLLPEMNVRLRPKLLALAPGTRIVAHEFGLGDWQPDQRTMAAGRNALLWVVPANVDGDWTLTGPQGTYRMRVAQRYQNFRGTLQLAGAASTPIEGGRLEGATIRFSFFDGQRVARFEGTVAGDRLVGSAVGWLGEWKGARTK